MWFRGLVGLSLVAALLTFAAVPATPAHAAPASRSWYVAQSGNAQFGAGTSCASPDSVGADDTAIRTVLEAVVVDDTVTISAGTYSITRTLVVDDSIAIQGVSASSVILDGGNAVQIMRIDDSVLESSAAPEVHLLLTDLTFTRGYAGPGTDNCNTQAQCGGAIYAEAGSGLTVLRSAFRGNRASFIGGAIANLEAVGFQSSKITIKDSTFSENTAALDGGAVAINSAALKEIVNSTFVANVATIRQGGALSVPNGGVANITASTFVDNVGVGATSAQALYGRAAVVKGSLFAGAAGKPMCFFEDVNSSVDDSSVSTGAGCGNALSVTYTSLNLLGLGHWGGPTPTVWIGPGSSAIDANNGTCPSADQRGAARTAPCDAGAFERQGPHSAGTTGSLDYPASVQLLATATATSTPSPDDTIPTPTLGYRSMSPSTCSVNAVNGLVAASALGTCSVQWYVAPTLLLNGATADDTLLVTKITQAPLVITSGSGPLVPGNGMLLSCTGGSGNGAVSYSAGASTGCYVSVINTDSYVVASNAWGTCLVTATKAADDTYASAQSTPVSVTLQKSTQSALTIVAPSSLIVGQSASLSTSGGSTGGAVTYGASPSSTCRVSGSTLTMSATGTCQVSATMAGDDTYLNVNATPASVIGTEPPPPDPTLMPGPPEDVTARAIGSTIVVTWGPPSYTGAFPVSTYQVVASPGGASCLASASTTTCAFDDLARGRSYTFTVRALNGIGWGVASAPSNAVFAPTPRITATGSRDGATVKVSGSTTGMPPRTLLTVRYRILRGRATPWVERTIVTASDGSFTWSRRSQAAVRVVVTGGGARSAPVTIAAQ